jgi:hypothetical protein
MHIGCNWTNHKMEEAIAQGPHMSAMDPAAMTQLALEVADMVSANQAWIVLWDDIRNNPMLTLKVSPVAMIQHKSRCYRAI